MTNTNLEILLVEDNPSDAELTIRALKSKNLSNHIHWVKDGEEALNYLFDDDAGHRKKPKVVLLDLKLPKIDGLEVLKRIKEDPNTALIPVVILTSSKEEKDILDSYKLGVNSYIVKPVEFDKFVAAVGELGLYWLLLNQSPY